MTITIDTINHVACRLLETSNVRSAIRYAVKHYRLALASGDTLAAEQYLDLVRGILLEAGRECLPKKATR